MICDDCGALDARQSVGGVLLCDRCADGLIAGITGMKELAEAPPPIVLSGPDGQDHTLRYRLWRAPTGIVAELEEVGPEPGEGFKFSVLGDHDAKVDDLIAIVADQAERRIKRQYLERSSHRSGWILAGNDAAGRLIWNSETDCGPYRVVIDGHTLSWDEFGEALEAFEGWEFRIGIDDQIADARPDADVIAFPVQPRTEPVADEADTAGGWSTDGLKRALASFEEELQKSGLSATAVRTYIDRSSSFVAWLDGDFHPGAPAAGGSLPDADLVITRRWVDRHNDDIPERARDQIRYELDIEDRSITLYECRPPWREGISTEWSRFPIVRLRYTKARKEWAIYWRDRNSKFHRYDPIPASRRLQELLDLVDGDQSGIFWG